MVLDAAQILDGHDLTADSAIQSIEGRWEWLFALFASEKDAVVRNGIMQYIFAFAMIVLGIKTYLIAERGATSYDIATLTSVSQGISNQVSALRADNYDRDAHIRYLHYPVGLRTESNAKSIIIKKIYPDQMLRALDERGGWVKIEVFEYHSEKTIVGWVNRRHLYRTP